MTPQAQLVVLLWLPLIFYFFNRFPPRTAVAISFIGGLLFLPQQAGFKLPLIPDYRGMTATCYGIILGVIIYDCKSLIDFKFKWMDIPMVIWCICPMLSSLDNGLGWYNGFNETFSQVTIWGLPYFIGRMYFYNLVALKELAIIIIKGGLIYAPFCLFESRFSPQLHRMVYGYHQHSFAQTIRSGGFRPTVFMQHGLMVAVWMMLALLTIFWLWKAKAIQKIWGMPMNWLVWFMLITFVLLKSTGAYIYFIYGLIILFIAKWLRTNLPVFLLVGAICYYLFINVSGTFNGSTLVAWAANYNQERAGSLEFRLNNEEILGAKARQRMVFGWGGWGRNRVFEENYLGELVDITITDSLWIIIFGTTGIVGIISFHTAMLFPVVRFCIQGYPVRTWFNPKVAPAAVLAVALALYIVDCLLNAMIIPIFPLISGGLTGLLSQSATSARKKLPTSTSQKPRIAARRMRTSYRNVGKNQEL